MKWIRSWLGLDDKVQIARTKEVTEFVKEKRGQFSTELKHLKVQAKKIHAKATKTADESARLVIMVSDITTQIAIASGSIKLDKKVKK